MNRQEKSLSRRDFCKLSSFSFSGTVLFGALGASAGALASAGQRTTEAPRRHAPFGISGRYPHLAMFNPVDEFHCPVGAIVPWANRLWVVTYFVYSPSGNARYGFYEITPDLALIQRQDGMGGTPANRMIHRESQQLFIGPYVIDQQGHVRVIPYEQMRGRLTANARHLTDPEHKIYFVTMEEGVYEVDVRTLEVRTLFSDGNPPGWNGKWLALPASPGEFEKCDVAMPSCDWALGREHLPGGNHGKGAYTGQGRLVYSGNGRSLGRPIANQISDLSTASGCLASWNGKGRQWEIVETRPFMEVTGPGGINGNDSPEAPIWSTGWDHRSVILKLLDQGEWHTYRLPKADYNNDGVSGSFTEWFRIRQVGPDGQYLMDHHGMWFEFPGDFSRAVHRAPLPIAAHLKVTPDFARWQDQVVFGCYDTAKGPIAEALAPWRNWVGLAQSNLWFTRWEELKGCGRPYGFGGPWLHDPVEAGSPSDPYAFRGFQNRQLHLSHKSDRSIAFELQIDRTGRGQWEPVTTLDVSPFGYVWHAFPDELQAEWIRLVPKSDGRFVTAHFHYGTGGGSRVDAKMFTALTPVDANVPRSVGLIRTGTHGKLEFAAWASKGNGSEPTAAGYYQLDADMQLRLVDDTSAHLKLQEDAKFDGGGFTGCTIDEASVIVIDERGRRYRLPKADASFEESSKFGARVLRGESHHKAFLNAGGILYTVARSTAGGVTRLRPVATHRKHITDFCLWRGLLILTGCRSDLRDPGKHFIRSDDGKAGLWLGDVDDLWKLGKPVGVGGPWKQTPVVAGNPSDPYLMTGFDQKTLTLSHDARDAVLFDIEVDVTPTIDLFGDDYYEHTRWRLFATVEVRPGEEKQYPFPDGFSAFWVRLKPNRSCRASALLTYV